MEPYQERVIEEKKELDEKLAKLNAFLRPDRVADVSVAEIILLLKQRKAMVEYSQVLAERIALWSKKK